MSAGSPENRRDLFRPERLASWFIFIHVRGAYILDCLSAAAIIAAVTHRSECFSIKRV